MSNEASERTLVKRKRNQDISNCTTIHIQTKAKIQNVILTKHDLSFRGSKTKVTTDGHLICEI